MKMRVYTFAALFVVPMVLLGTSNRAMSADDDIGDCHVKYKQDGFGCHIMDKAGDCVIWPTRRIDCVDKDHGQFAQSHNIGVCRQKDGGLAWPVEKKLCRGSFDSSGDYYKRGCLRASCEDKQELNLGF